MKETGLIFKAPLVRAILEGRKTQTLCIHRAQRSFDVELTHLQGTLATA